MWLMVTETKVIFFKISKWCMQTFIFVQNVKIFLRDLGIFILIHWAFTHIKTKVHYIAQTWSLIITAVLVTINKQLWHWVDIRRKQHVNRLENTKWYVFDLYNSNLLILLYLYKILFFIDLFPCRHNFTAILRR